MKRLLVLGLAFILAGCAALAPASPTPAATSTPQIIIQTVLVTVIPTEKPTATPTLTPIPTLTPQIVVVTATSGATEGAGTASATSQAASPQAAAPGTSPTATLPADAGGGIFTNLTRSTDHFAVNCQPDTVTFAVSPTSPSVTGVDLFYRIEDQLSTSISGWVDIGGMARDTSGNFTFDFKASMVYPDLRSHRAWFDYQFVALGKTGQVLGRSAKISKQIKYAIDCTD